MKFAASSADCRELMYPCVVNVAPLTPAMLALCADSTWACSCGRASSLICWSRGSWFGYSNALTSVILPVLMVTSTCTSPYWVLTAAPFTLVVEELVDVGATVIDLVLIFGVVDGAVVAGARCFGVVDGAVVAGAGLFDELDDVEGAAGVEGMVIWSVGVVVLGSGPAAEETAVADPAETT